MSIRGVFLSITSIFVLLISITLRQKYTKHKIKNNEFLIEEKGWLKKEKQVIHIDNIIHIHRERNFFQRLTGKNKIKFVLDDDENTIVEFSNVNNDYYNKVKEKYYS